MVKNRKSIGQVQRMHGFHHLAESICVYKIALLKSVEILQGNSLGDKTIFTYLESLDLV